MFGLCKGGRAAVAVPVALLLALAPLRPALADAEDPAQFVRAFLSQSSGVFTKGSSLPARVGALRALFDANMDIPLLANFMAGKAYRDASPALQAKFRDLLTRHLVQVFYETVEDFAGGSFEVDPAATSAPSGNTVDVRTMVREPGYPPEAVIWRVRRSDSAFRIVEVVNKGVNIMVMERDSFVATLREGGLEKLVAVLETRDRATQPPG